MWEEDFHKVIVDYAETDNVDWGVIDYTVNLPAILIGLVDAQPIRGISKDVKTNYALVRVDVWSDDVREAMVIKNKLVNIDGYRSNEGGTIDSVILNGVKQNKQVDEGKNPIYLYMIEFKIVYNNINTSIETNLEEEKNG